MMLGATAGGAVRLTDGPSRLVVAEGIESGLSLLCGLLDAPRDGMGRAFNFGPARAAPAPATRAADHCPAMVTRRAAKLGTHWPNGRTRWAGRFRFCPAPGADFNDVLTGKAVAA